MNSSSIYSHLDAVCVGGLSQQRRVVVGQLRAQGQEGEKHQGGAGPSKLLSQLRWGRLSAKATFSLGAVAIKLKRAWLTAFL